VGTRVKEGKSGEKDPQEKNVVAVALGKEGCARMERESEERRGEGARKGWKRERQKLLMGYWREEREQVFDSGRTEITKNSLLLEGI